MRWRHHISPRPHDRPWRTAMSFAIGSALFALGSLPLLTRTVDQRALGVVFVVGSLFFTAGGYGQFRLVTDDDDTFKSRWSPAGRADAGNWWAAIIQLIGTVLFNVSTVDALFESLSAEQENRLVWAPDMLGSIAFVTAATVTWSLVCGGRWCVRLDDPNWWAALLNGVGSVFFFLAAIASYTLTTTDQVLNTTIVNSGTFLGALCFLGGSWVLLPPEPETPSPSTGSS